MGSQYADRVPVADQPAPYLKLGQRLRELRKQAGDPSQEVLARLLHISPSYVSALENGRFQPTTGVLEAYERVLGADYNELAELAGHLKRTDSGWSPPPDKLAIIRRLTDHLSLDRWRELERFAFFVLLGSAPPDDQADAEHQSDQEPDEPEAETDRPA